jgi:hypothetical protein
MRHLSEIAKRIAAMPEAERQAVAASIPAILTIEGHPLSVRNSIMLSMQHPGITIVGGFRQWLAEGRCVRKGEKASYILHPCKRKQDSDTEEAGVWFREAAVFDVSQTEALPEGARKAEQANPAPVERAERAPRQAPASEYYSDQFTPL